MAKQKTNPKTRSRRPSAAEQARARQHGEAVAKREAAKVELAEARDFYAGTIISKEGGFTPAFATASHGLKPHTQAKAVKLSDRFDQQNPIYRAAIDITASFILGDGFTVTAQNADVNALLADAWDLNCLDDELPEMVRSGEKFGEQFYPAYLGADGLVTLGVIHPSQVRDVQASSRRRPGDAVTVVEAPETRAGAPIEHEVIRRDKKASEKGAAWVYDREGGDDGAGCFYLPLNRSQGAVRGMPSFIAGFGYFEQASDALWTALERLRLLNRIGFDIEVDGTDEEAKQLENDLRLSGPPRPLTQLVHTKNITWKVLQIEAGASEFVQILTANIQFLANATLIPPHILATPQDVNRATAAEMGEPMLRNVERKQARWVAFLRQFCSFQIWYARQKGLLRGVPEDELGFEVQASPIRATDRLGEVKEMQAMSDLALYNRTRGFWTREEAVTIVRAHAHHMEIDQADEVPDELLTAPIDPVGADPSQSERINTARAAFLAQRDARRAQEAA